MVNTIKIKTIYGKLLTIKIQEQTSEYISGFDKFGIFCKIPLDDIKSCDSMGAGL
jgi:hypothetical protein